MRRILLGVFYGSIFCAIIYQSYVIGDLRLKLSNQKQSEFDCLIDRLDNIVSTTNDVTNIIGTNLSDDRTSLEEVEGYNKEDIIQRIDLLNDHLFLANEYPSANWTKSVLLECKRTIISLRE